MLIANLDKRTDHFKKFDLNLKFRSQSTTLFFLLLLFENAIDDRSASVKRVQKKPGQKNVWSPKKNSAGSLDWILKVFIANTFKT